MNKGSGCADFEKAERVCKSVQPGNPRYLIATPDVQPVCRDCGKSKAPLDLSAVFCHKQYELLTLAVNGELSNDRSCLHIELDVQSEDSEVMVGKWVRFFWRVPLGWRF